MRNLLDFLSYIIWLYTLVVIAYVIMGWLMNFNIINAYNPTVRAIYRALSAFVEPLLRPIRNILPDTGPVDVSPIILLLGCLFVDWVIIGNLRHVF
jgi:YggT family protein